MHRLCILIIMLMATAIGAAAQENTENMTAADLAPYALVPAARDAMGRAVVEVVGPDGAPLFDALVTLESKWSGGTQRCESFGGTNRHGAIALPAIHIGDLKLVVKAKGFATYKAVVAPSDLARPIRVTMAKK